MKHILSFLLAAALLLTCASAHPGGTDGQGGHIDHSTGEYHYHHGYPAHQHPNGTCIYEFDDKTGQNSGTPGGGGSKTTQKATTRVFATTTRSVQTNKESNDLLYDVIVLFIFFGLPLVGIFWFILTTRIKERKRLIAEEQRRISEEKARYQRYCARYDFLFEVFGEDVGKIDLDAIPDDITFSPSCLPIKGDATESEPFGLYTVYISARGKCFHYSPHCIKNAVATHLFTAIQYYTHEPCSHCVKWYHEQTIPDWYIPIQIILNSR